MHGWLVWRLLHAHVRGGVVRHVDLQLWHGDISTGGKDMKRAVLVLSMGLCAAAAALHAEPAGTVQFRGLIVQETCVGAVATTGSMEAQQAHSRCMQGVGGMGGAGGDPIYTEHREAVGASSGIDLLDYYVDLVRARPGVQVQLISRDYG